ncbi:recombinase family protein [Streptomyces brevispora]|uniref:recombinase family protein n=1 Tax=Streptomyces brevispora TaxID=887462 RepID=UPI0035D60E22
MTADSNAQQEKARSQRAIRARAAAGSQRATKHRSDWKGQTAAIYCRISHASDEDQTGVDRQERICRDVAERLGLTVAEDQVFVDNNRSAWQRKRKRPGWDALLAQASEGRIRHVLTYHPDRLMRQPRDLEELLQIADDHDITLHGQANRRDLADPDDRFFLRIEVAHACRSSDDTSRRLLDAMVDRAKDGKPHTGRRRYGYDKTGTQIIPKEAAIVKEIFTRYLEGVGPNQLV